MKTTAILCAWLIMAIATFVVGATMRTRRQAKMLINELKDLSVSPSPNDTFDSFQWKFGHSNFKHSDACTFHFCTYEVDVSNRAIATLHLVPYTEMKTWFTVERSQLVQGLVEYRTALKAQNSPVVHIQQGMCGHRCGVRFDVNPHGTTQEMWNGIVEFDSRATAEQRDAALALNLGCFARIGGCKDIIDLLPTMWARSGSGKIASRWVGLSQTLEESHGLPSVDDF